MVQDECVITGLLSNDRIAHHDTIASRPHLKKSAGLVIKLIAAKCESPRVCHVPVRANVEGIDGARRAGVARCPAL